MPPVNENGRHGIQGKQRFDTVGFTGTQSESSFGTPSPRSGTPSPLHKSLQFPVAEASEAANRNVGFTSICGVPFLATNSSFGSIWPVRQADRMLIFARLRRSRPNQVLGDGLLALFGMGDQPGVACRQAIAASAAIATRVESLIARWVMRCSSRSASASASTRA